MGKKHLEGFTLIELLVLMMVLAITIGFGVPAFNNMVASNRMTAAANDLISSLHTARNAALTRNASVTLCASSNTDSVQPEQPDCDAGALLLAGWIVFADDNANGVVDGDEVVLLTHGSVHDSILSQAGSGADQPPPQYLLFRSDGSVPTLTGLPEPIRSIQLCDSRGNRDMGGGIAAGRWIAISSAGRPTLTDRVLRLQDTDTNPLGGC